MMCYSKVKERIVFKKGNMKQGSTIFLRLALLAMALIALALCIFAVPPVSHEVAEFLGMDYLRTLIMAGAYISALAFFAALYQTFKLLGLIDSKQAFSSGSVAALKNIKYCGVVIGTMFTFAMPVVYLVAEKDDAPGLIIFGAAFVGAALTVSVFAALLGQLLQDALKIKSENDLTV